MREIKREKFKLIILDILKDSELHGYGISEKIDEMYGIGKPSSGIIYPTLSNLKKRGLIKICAVGGRDKKVYSITPEGLKYLKERENELIEAKRILKNLGEFYSIGGKRIIEDIEKLVKNMHKLDDESKNEISNAIKELHRKIERVWMVEGNEQ